MVDYQSPYLSDARNFLDGHFRDLFIFFLCSKCIIVDKISKLAYFYDSVNIYESTNFELMMHFIDSVNSYFWFWAINWKNIFKKRKKKFQKLSNSFLLFLAVYFREFILTKKWLKLKKRVLFHVIVNWIHFLYTYIFPKPMTTDKSC